MKFKCRPADLLRELEFLSAVANAKHHPALGHVLIEARRSGVALTTYDLKTRLCSAIAVPVEETGAGSADAKMLLAWLGSALPYREVSIETDTTGKFLITRVTNLQGQFVSLNTDFFAKVEDPVPQLTMPTALLNTMATRTKFAVSTEEHRYSLQGALFDVLENGALRMAATDGNRMAICQEQLGTRSAPFTALVPTAVLNLLPRMAVSGTVTVGQSETNVFFVAGARSITGRKMSGTFPDYERTLPNEFDFSFFAEINGEALREGLEAVLPFIEEEPWGVQFHFANGDLTLSTRHGSSGEAKVSLLRSDPPEPFDIILSSSYVLDFLKRVDGNSIIARFGDGVCAAKFENGSAYTYYVMPINPEPGG